MNQIEQEIIEDFPELLKAFWPVRLLLSVVLCIAYNVEQQFRAHTALR
jgi:hypothetical protein